MNKIFKIVSSTVAAVVMLTGGVVYAGAANAPVCANAVQGSNCDTISSSRNGFLHEVEEKIKSLGGTNDAESALEKLCKTNANCELNSALEKIGGTNCNSDVKSALEKICGTNCNGDVKSVLEKICKANGNCDINSLLKQICGGKCPDFNTCLDAQKPTQATEPAEEPTEKPATKPTAPTEEPTEKPTQAPTQAPTEAATEAPTQAPTTVPTVTEPATTQPAQTSDFNKAYEDEVIRLVNVERAKYGLPALAKRDDATNAAEIRAKEIVRNFSHTRPNGTSCFTVAAELGISYRSVGENIAYGYATPAQVVNGWMNSAGHRANILSSSFTGLGVGCYKQGSTLYWSQFFIG